MSCFTLVVQAQTPHFCKQIEYIKKVTEATHVQPKPYDNAMSEGIYMLLMEYIDEDRMNFTEQQVAAFAHLKTNIDNALRNNDCSLLRTLIKEYKAYLASRVAFLKENLTKSQDYTGADSLLAKGYNHEQLENQESTLENENKETQKVEDTGDDYFETDTLRAASWSRFLRLEILTRIARTQPTLNKAQETFQDEEKRIRELLINEELCAKETLLADETLDKKIEELFLHAFMIYHDPHSAFFNPTEKTTFETDLATNQETYGLFVDKNTNDEFYVAHLIPGSAAYLHGKLQEDDVLLNLTTNGIAKSLYCTSADEVNGFLASPEHRMITLEIRKKNGNTHTITLTKGKTTVEKNRVQGYVLGQQDKVGYLRIPTFYTDLDMNYGLGIANDVAKEIYRLQQEAINGLVIDLRGNGGGSLKEAIDLVGLFIDRGPVSPIVTRSDGLETTTDFNNGAAYKGPLAVLVDTYSASASELFAATIKTYRRGIIVGQPTYGKATLQNVIPLNPKNESLGFVKMTRGAFFNVDGSTLQGAGVQPHITLPMIGASRATHEHDEPFNLKIDSVAVDTPFQKLPLDFEQVIKNSLNRIDNNPFLQQIKQQDRDLTKLLQNYPDVLPLSLDGVYPMIKTRDKGLVTITETAPEPLVEAHNTPLTNQLIARNELLAKNNKELLEYLSKDPHIAECRNIVLDLKSIAH